MDADFGQLEPEFHAPYGAWKTGPSPTTTGALLAAVGPVIGSALGGIGPAGKSPLLRSRARRIVVDALPGYDPHRARLGGYLSARLRGLHRASAEQNDLIRVPERVRLDQFRLHETTGRLRDDLGREPSDAELADAAGISLRRIAHVRKAVPAAPEGAMVAPGEGGLEPFDPLVAAGRGDSDERVEFVYWSLGPVDRVILEHSLGLRGRKRLENRQIARLLNVTPSAVSQRRAKIQKTIDEIGGEF